MYAHRQNVTVTEGHEVRVKLPDDFPAGDAEVIVLATPPPPTATRQPLTREPLEVWLQKLHSQLPPCAASVPLEALRRERMYEDD